MPKPLFLKAIPYQNAEPILPTTDLDRASNWYSAAFGMIEVERHNAPTPQLSWPTVIMERDGVRLGFALNGGRTYQNGATILVSDLDKADSLLAENSVSYSPIQIDYKSDQQLHALFVVAPDGLCYYFFRPSFA